MTPSYVQLDSVILQFSNFSHLLHVVVLLSYDILSTQYELQV